MTRTAPKSVFEYEPLQQQEYTAQQHIDEIEACGAGVHISEQGLFHYTGDLSTPDQNHAYAAARGRAKRANLTPDHMVLAIGEYTSPIVQRLMERHTQ